MQVSEPGPSRDSIPLYLINGVATIWDAQVAATLHCTHGISGYRAGTLPGVSQQNAFLGLPVTLMREETAYLVSTGIAHLVPVHRPTVPAADVIAAHTAARVLRIQEREEKRRLASEKKNAEAQAAFEKAGDKARAKREARAKAKAEKLLAAGQDPLLDADASKTHDTVTPASSPATATTPSPATGKAKGKAVDTVGYFYSVPAIPLEPDPSLGQEIISIPHPLFPFPKSIRDTALVAIFKTLSDRGYRIGLGPRFGGEYLVYPGDYLRYHAHFTSQVIVRQEPIKPTEIVAWGRLGTGTKKAGLLCCWDDGREGEQEPTDTDGEVEFYSLEWANFG